MHMYTNQTYTVHIECRQDITGVFNVLFEYYHCLKMNHFIFRVEKLNNFIFFC